MDGNRIENSGRRTPILNITEPYCSGQGFNRPVFKMVLALFDTIKPGLLPKCPVTGRIGVKNLTINYSFIENFPLKLHNVKGDVRFSFYTGQMEPIFYMKFVFTLHNKYRN